MIRSGLLLAALMPLFSLTALAQDSNVIIQKKPTVIEESSSEHNRMGKKFVVAAQLTGLSYTAGAGVGVIAGYHLNRNTIAQLEVTGSERENSSWEKLKTNSVGAHLKHFMANSFYVKGGLDYSTIKYDNDYVYNSSGTKKAYGFDGNLLSAAVVIGNQWQWENFTLGCDWIGFMFPVSHTIKSEYADAGWANAAKYNKEDQEKVFNETSAQLLRFYLGATF